MSQIERVLAAVRDGCRTSPEVHMETKLPVKHCCAHLRMLESRGYVKRTGTVPAEPSGRRAVFYEPTERRSHG